MTNTDEREALIIRFEDETGLNLGYILENEKPEDIDTLIEKLEEGANEIECIYYHNAMAYLSEHDVSLRASLALAHDMGCTIENLNSETLATILMQQNAREKIYEYKDELEEVLFTDDNE